MSELSVYQFEEPRHFLAEVLKRKQERNPSFSLRTWSKQLGFTSPSGLSMVLSGQRRLQLPVVTRVCESLRLKDEEQRYLQVLTLYSNAETTDEKKLYSDVLAKLRPRSRASTLSIDRFRLVSDWYHFVIYEMADLRDFRSDPEWVARRLGHGITAAVASEALERLVRLGMLQRGEDGNLRKVAGEVSTTDDIPSDALKRFHAQMIEKSIGALKTQDVAEREISTYTMSIDASKLDQAKQLLRRFQQELAAICESPAGDEVYQFNTQFFRITEGKREEGERK